uniref:Uncharacterized protein n=1 Tax=Micrurus surinamensis TaxID=129470 RepID=A0A2D4NL72_MICSU
MALELHEKFHPSKWLLSRQKGQEEAGLLYLPRRALCGISASRPSLYFPLSSSDRRAPVALPVMLSGAISLQLRSEQAVACLLLQPSQDVSPLRVLKGNKL